MELLQKIKLAWTQYRAFHRALAELNGYSDRELSDLGLTRADIVRNAYEEAERMPPLTLQCSIVAMCRT